MRTVQRWEKREGLLVHRHQHAERDTVYAYKAELDAWWNNRSLDLVQKDRPSEPMRWRYWPWVLAATVGVILCAWFLLPSPLRLAERAPAIESVAVLPFANVTGDPEVEYLSDGISESILESLSRVPKLRKVIARTSVAQYKGRAVEPRTAGRELRVAAVVTGRVAQRGQDLIIEAELVQVADGARLWGGRYQRKMTDLLTVQEEISSEISEKLRLRLSGAERQRLAKRYTSDTEAYQLYLKGRYYWNKRTEEGMARGIAYFQQAIAKDPRYALAYAGLADCYLLSYDMPPKEALQKVKVAATRALELDDTLAEAHASMAFARFFYEWDWLGAEREFKRSLELNPSYATAHHWYGEYLEARGQFDEAIAEIKRGLELDPVSLIINADLGAAFYVARRYGQAIDQLRKTLQLDPNFALAHSFLGMVYEQKGMFEQAIAERQKAVILSAGAPGQLARLGHSYAVAGRRKEAVKILARLKQLSNQRYVRPYDIALMYVGLGETEQAFEWLEKAYEDRTGELVYIDVVHQFDPLRSDPRFQDLLRRIGLPP